ncbi:glycerophosphodiester phosphodiesterase 1 [Hydra vulgaris]|uniref:glycerophosphodiester phosphodiesterase 1 n=1 Tax=Hydra vulgaris TaxID=6087 RepID=UPI0002B478AB|nr:glycerophosphodiester phosphodiesterase 1-like [Hydra vulgaris]
MFILAVILLPVIAILSYNHFKLPKQSIEQTKKILFRNNKAIIIGHRGGQFEAPENTLIAIKTAYKNGGTAVEIDVDFTKDGVPILHHDDEVDRVTNSTGLVKEFMWNDLKKLNAASKFNYTITKGLIESVEFEGIPLLIDAIKLCMKYKLSINLDIKSNASGITNFLKDLLLKEPQSPDFIFVTSFMPHIVYKVRKECSQFGTGLIWRPHLLSRKMNGEPYDNQSIYLTLLYDILDYLYMWSVHLWLVDFLGVSLMSINKNYLIENGNIEYWRNQGIEVIVWTVNNVEEKKIFLSKNVPVITDSLLNSEYCPEPI